MLLLQALVVAPLAFLSGHFVVPSARLDDSDVALFGAGALNAVFFLTAFELQRRAGPVGIGQLGNVIIIAALLIGVAVFGESYPPAALLAAAVVLAGVTLVNRNGTNEPVPLAVKIKERTS